ncbi:unnamed protein product [Symbiodinium necroappetens]|uniref:Uncharacterized protein n=1 Tax=Symbiodinium necroappetens TaxID=1628268 RepID=A0A812V3Y3_9DINO|nr:unnamed protein product [Symbiodinium necroappetens]|eukprot:CAMPEP_0181447008 /NCGR_PEP_ID=MMETSP1110-20121109/26401_1 /TAXON_ID=174948 /ORGANISM="Symbiodinium sp., Strain CCMP421" /LENGTH=424 /DNA_ID=CAMNT_0023571109 /DNA_START=43 /DNA_END=1317 /DNA_ORIENTATION=+
MTTAGRPCNVLQWFEQVPQLLSEHGWCTAVRGNSSALAHCECPWGGKLVRFCFRGIPMRNVQEPARSLVRPETRAEHEPQAPLGFDLLQQLAPGDAVLQHRASWNLLQLCSLVFGDVGMPAFVPAKTPITCRQKLYRACPGPEDTTLMFSTMSGQASDALLICRTRAPEMVDLTAAFSMTSSRFDQWMSTHLCISLESARCKATCYFNRPGLAEMRAIDAKMYRVLVVNSCKRGPPLLPLPPDSSEEPAVRVRTDDDPILLESWIRMPSGKFHFAAFVNQFTRNLRLDLEAFDTLDGQRLVHYQCVVRSDRWASVQEMFMAAFNVQRRAYRRLNGGSIAPSVCADAEPRFVFDDKLAELSQNLTQEEETSAQHHVKVRRTFLEVDEDSDSDDEAFQRPSRRAKTTPRNWPSSDSDESDEASEAQ